MMFSPPYLSRGMLVFLCASALLALGLVVWKRIIPTLQKNRRQHTNASSNGKHSHWLDAAILVALAAPMFLIMKLGVTSLLDKMMLHHLSSTHPWIAVVALLLIWLCALKFDSTLACLLLAVATTLGAFGLPNLQKPEKLSAASLYSLPGQKKLDLIRVQLVDPIENADLTIDGVSFGKLPCETTFKELLSKIPKEYTPTRLGLGLEGDFDAKAHGYLQTVNDRMSYNKEVSISFHTRFAQYERENSLPLNSLGDYQSVYFSVCVGNTSGYILTNNKRHRVDDDGVFQVFLEVKFEDSERKFGQLIKRVKLEGYQPSPEWLKAFSTFGRHGLVDLKSLGKSDQKLLQVFELVIRDKFGISNDLSSQKAWGILERIREQAGLAGKFDYTMPEFAAAKLLVPYLDPQQVADEVLANIAALPINRSSIALAAKTARGKERQLLSLKPLMHVARLIDENLSRKDPDHYNVFEKQIGETWIARNPPEPPRYSMNDVVRFLDGLAKTKGSDPISPGMKSLVRTGYQAVTKFQRPPFGSLLADGFVKKQASTGAAKAISRALGDDHWISDLAGKLGLTLPVGEKELLGSVEVDRWQKELLFLDSPTGRKYRKKNEKEVLELAIRSIGPLAKKEIAPEDKNLSLVLGAIQSTFSQNFNGGVKWPLPHLEFIFIDAEARINASTPADADSPSLAMKFWPYFDSMFEATDSIAARHKLKVRWMYLARIWTESNEEMFVDAYFKTGSPDRQASIADGIYGTGLPKSIPVKSRLGIYKRMLERAKTLPLPERSIKMNSFLGRESETSPKNELESIKHAIGTLDCPEGATAYTEIWTKNFAKTDLAKLRSADTATISVLQRRLSHSDADNPFARLPRDDRIEAFARHENPVLRQIAVAIVRERPTPRLVGLLNTLKSDEVAEVSSLALEVKKELDELLAAPVPRIGAK